MFLRNCLLLGLIFSITSCQFSPPAKLKSQPKNIILFIGDGMGPSYMKAYRMYRDDPATREVEPTVFDKLLVGALKTDPQNIGKVTDSAASASAYATGYKAVNGTLSIDKTLNPRLTVLEAAKRQHKSTGLVATSQITDATPAAFAAHQLHRREYDTVANQYIDNRFQGRPYVDVLLGGGKRYFIRDDRNIAEEFESMGYEFLTNKTQLQNTNQSKLLGLFADTGMKKMFDRDQNTPSLADMTKVAIEQLSKNEAGFFLIVEGSQIDWAGHRNDIVGAMSEMQDFESALQVGLDFAGKDNQTQIIVTADHSTGGLSVGATINGKAYYEWKAEVVRSFLITPEEIVKRAIQSGNLLTEFKKATRLKLTENEIKTFSEFNPEQKKQALDIITKIINERSYTGWTTYGHTGVDVLLYAYGPASDRLSGLWDNTKIAKFIFTLLKRTQQ